MPHAALERTAMPFPLATRSARPGVLPGRYTNPRGHGGPEDSGCEVPLTAAGSEIGAGVSGAGGTTDLFVLGTGVCGA